jgi:hypothetical protein
MKVRNDGKERVTPVTDQGWEDFENEVEPEQFEIDACIEHVEAEHNYCAVK